MTIKYKDTLNTFLLMLISCVAVAKLYKVVVIFLYNQITTTKLEIWPLLVSGSPITSIQQLLSHILFAPLIETLVFQALIYHLLSKLTQKTSIFIACSASVFALLHLLSGAYKFGYTFLLGLIFAYCYQYFMRKYNLNVALVTTLLLHTSYNALAIVF